MMQSNIAIIPARGGSKRIPKKNLVRFIDRPMIAHTIQAAIDCGRFDRVYVDTDNAEIAKESRKFGAEVPFLREIHMDDFSTVSDSTIEFCNRLSSAQVEFTTVTQLFAVTPLRTAADINLMLDHFFEAQHKTLLSCSVCSWPNPYWSGELKSSGEIRWLFPNMLNHRSQDLPQLFVPSGAVWIASLEALRENQSFYHADTRYFPLPFFSCIDIDTMQDLQLAEAMHHMLEQKNH